MAEQRKHIRITYNISITYKVIGHILQSSTRTEDISEGGIRMPSKQRFDLGMILGLDITLSGEIKSIPAEGEIVWIKETRKIQFPYMLGIKFIKIHPLDLAKIKSFITKMSSNEVQWMG
jgi:c-di-GMP-binding flagellar brake protein YcgR